MIKKNKSSIIVTTIIQIGLFFGILDGSVHNRNPQQKKPCLNTARTQKSNTPQPPAAKKNRTIPTVKKPEAAQETPTKTKEEKEIEINREDTDRHNQKILADQQKVPEKNSLTQTKASPGWLMGAYYVAIPIILKTLNSSLGSGIAAGTKVMIKLWLNKPELIARKKKLTDQTNIIFDTFKTQKISDLPADVQKIAISNLLAIDTIDETTSFRSIAANSLYTAAINSIVGGFGTLIAIGASMMLQSLMPQQ